MNWGLKITLLYVGFVAMILTLVFKASGEKVELVTKDYYAQELVHQDKMNAIRRASTWKGKILFSVEQDQILVTLPETFPTFEKGEINVYRPSDSALDKSFPLNSDTNVLKAKEWTTGYYIVQLSWELNKENYYLEETVFLP